MTAKLQPRAGGYVSVNIPTEIQKKLNLLAGQSVNIELNKKNEIVIKEV